jgi:hypothetical protein
MRPRWRSWFLTAKQRAVEIIRGVTVADRIRSIAYHIVVPESPNECPTSGECRSGVLDFDTREGLLKAHLLLG